MGKVYSSLTRPIRTFNIANRAEKVISREKPVPAPQYEYTKRQKKISEQVNPNFLEDHYRKNVQLDQRLKDVFITSTDSQETIVARDSKFLPQDRYRTDELVSDYFETAKASEGKCSLKQAFTFISQHKHDPTTHNSENIAAEYKLDKQVVDDILKHFKPYVTIIPDYPDQIEVDPLQGMFDQSVKQYEEMKKLGKKKER